MTTNRRSTTILVAAAAVVVIVGVAFVALLFVSIRNAPSEPPKISAYADGHAEQISPFRFCPVERPLCEYDGATTILPVRPGHPLQLSLPTEIADAPWVLATVYATNDGSITEKDEFYLPDSRHTVTVAPVDDEGRSLVGVEVRLPSGVIDVDTNEEEIVSHAIWSIATTVS